MRIKLRNSQKFYATKNLSGMEAVASLAGLDYNYVEIFVASPDSVYSSLSKPPPPLFIMEYGPNFKQYT